jgi:hypothetical protein
VKAILDSQIVKKSGVTDQVRGLLESSEEVQTVLKELNLNPLTDIDQLTVAVCSGTDPDKGLIILRGKFDIEKFKAKADDAAKDFKDFVTIHKAPDGTGGQHTVYEVTPPGAPTSIFVAFASKTTIVAGAAKDYVLDALDKETGRKKTQLKNKDVQDLLSRLDSKLMIAVAMPAKTVSAIKQVPDIAREYLDKMTDIIVGVEFDKDIKANLIVTARKASDATALNDTLTNGLDTATILLTAAAQQNKDMRVALNVVKSIRPSMREKTITVEVTVTLDMIQQLLKNLPQP